MPQRSTLCRAPWIGDWNAELVRGDLGKAVQQLKRESGNGLFLGGVRLPQALADHVPASAAPTRRSTVLAVVRGGRHTEGGR